MRNHDGGHSMRDASAGMQELGTSYTVQTSREQCLGKWQQVYCSQVAGRQGPSGISMS